MRRKWLGFSPLESPRLELPQSSRFELRKQGRVETDGTACYGFWTLDAAVRKIGSMTKKLDCAAAMHLSDGTKKCTTVASHCTWDVRIWFGQTGRKLGDDTQTTLDPKPSNPKPNPERVSTEKMHQTLTLRPEPRNLEALNKSVNPKPSPP